MRTERPLTAEGIWQLPRPATGHYELVAGELIEAPEAGALRGLLAGLVYRLLGDEIAERDLGLAFGDNTAYLVRRNPDRLRVPDVSIIAWERTPEGEVPEGYGTVASTLVVEIASPHEQVEETEARVRDWVAAGTRLAWTLWPQRQVVTVNTPDEAVREFGPEDELDGGAPLPDFHARVATLFAVRRRR